MHSLWSGLVLRHAWGLFSLCVPMIRQTYSLLVLALSGFGYLVNGFLVVSSSRCPWALCPCPCFPPSVLVGLFFARPSEDVFLRALSTWVLLVVWAWSTCGLLALLNSPMMIHFSEDSSCLLVCVGVEYRYFYSEESCILDNLLTNFRFMTGRVPYFPLLAIFLVQ